MDSMPNKVSIYLSKKGKTNYCETVFISKLDLKKEVTQPGD